MKNRIRSTLILCGVTVALAGTAGVFTVLHGRRAQAFIASDADGVISVSDGQGHILPNGADSDLGTVFMGDSPFRDFDVKNVGTGVIALHGTGSCGCTQVLLKADTLAPGETTRARVIYDSASKANVTGKVTQPFVLVATDSDGSGHAASGSVSVNVRPSLTFSRPQATFVFDLTDATSTLEQVVEITNRAPRTVNLRLRRTDPLPQVSVRNDDGGGMQLKPGETKQIALAASAPQLKGQDAVVAREVVTIDARFVDTSRSDGPTVNPALHFAMPVVLRRRRSAFAVPGSVIFSRAALQATQAGSQQPVDTIEIKADQAAAEGFGPTVKVTAVQTSTPALRVKKSDGLFYLYADVADVPALLDEAVTFDVQLTGDDGEPTVASVTVPVVMTP